jgi:phosphatidylglycerophosphate synthase
MVGSFSRINVPIEPLFPSDKFVLGVVILFLKVSGSFQSLCFLLLLSFHLSLLYFLGLLLRSGEEIVVEISAIRFLIPLILFELQSVFFSFVLRGGAGLGSAFGCGPRDVEHHVVCLHVVDKV